jgi:hypothetical protein
MPYRGGVQLLPENQRRVTLASYTTGNTTFYFGVALIVAMGITGAVLRSYSASVEDDIARLDGQLENTEQSRDRKQEAELLEVNKQSKLFNSLLTSKLYWTQALGTIEQFTQPSVRIKQLEASATKATIVFFAITDSLTSVSRQLASFQAATGTKDVLIKSIKATPEGTIEFAGEIQIDVNNFLRKANERAQPR